jgi:hypothetical protein
MLSSANINAVLQVKHEGFFRYIHNRFVFQLKALSETYTALQHNKYTPGLQLTINVRDFVTDDGQLPVINTTFSSVTLTVADNTLQQLVLTVKDGAVYVADTAALTLQLTAEAESFMQLATAIRRRQDETIKHGVMTLNLYFDGIGLLKFSVTFQRSNAASEPMF